MDNLAALAGHFELHDDAAIREAFANGADPNEIYKGLPLVYELIGEYTRSPRFRDCVRAFKDHGLKMEDEFLPAVLLDDASALDALLVSHPRAVAKKYNLPCAYTPLSGCTLLHICAEFNHVASAEILVKHGADVNAKAATDKFGFGGQTPVFHTVNQNTNQSAAMLDFLLVQKADLRITVAGIIWGKGYPWETLIPAVNPVSYAMFGMLPQMHRDEKTIAGTVSKLLLQGWDIDYQPRNIPNAYLKF